MSTVPNLPKTYRVALIEKKDEPFKLVSRDLVPPKEGQVLVKVLACGVCHSDGIVKHELMPVLPRVPGHEIIGDVVAIPAGEKKWKLGDRVGSGWQGGWCGTCSRCLKHDNMTCENGNINGILTDGGYGEYVYLRTEAVASIPKELDPAEAAPLMCAGITTFNSLRHMDVKPGEIVAIQGIGGLGHLAIQYSRAMGYRTVALSTSAAKETLAKKLGAHIYLDSSKVDQAAELQKLGGAKVMVCTAPSAEAIPKLLDGIIPGGTLLLLALAGDIVFPTLPIISKRIRVLGWPNGTAEDGEDTADFSKLQNIKCMVERYPLDDVEKAYELMSTNKAKFRAVIVPGLVSTPEMGEMKDSMAMKTPMMASDPPMAPKKKGLFKDGCGCM
ncbi:GroES-like protein [Sistotremastrum niveocremeum HHB9708]|uniref:GroES-like protein n=2 Tax=Sistotremastraceae TaxID=3402574 RepID=A0A164PMY3_9AGAM|nr:GroES-like protein [Sistotremastrum niveocremeum HHB9708]KZT34442.1 GroES-like protein [Sistotremastrum suecicum HHB10207 ss-3]